MNWFSDDNRIWYEIYFDSAYLGYSIDFFDSEGEPISSQGEFTFEEPDESHLINLLSDDIRVIATELLPGHEYYVRAKIRVADPD